MSKDATYIFVYNMFDREYSEQDMLYLTEKYGGNFEYLDQSHSFFWNKPKHTLPSFEYDNLHCMQILEKTEDCETWGNVYPEAIITSPRIQGIKDERELIGFRKLYAEKCQENMQLYQELMKWKDLYKKDVRIYKAKNIMDAQKIIDDGEKKDE